MGENPREWEETGSFPGRGLCLFLLDSQDRPVLAFAESLEGGSGLRAARLETDGWIDLGSLPESRPNSGVAAAAFDRNDHLFVVYFKKLSPWMFQAMARPAG